MFVMFLKLSPLILKIRNPSPYLSRNQIKLRKVWGPGNSHESWTKKVGGMGFQSRNFFTMSTQKKTRRFRKPWNGRSYAFSIK